MLERWIDTEGFKIDGERLCEGSCDFLQKTASVVPESIEFFKGLQTKPGHINLLVIGMTASEYYGANKNGDYFREEDLKNYYKSFETSGVFWNHDNKDMSKSSGKVLKSFYNSDMHRVELIIEIPVENARYIPDYIETGKPISVSMGLRTPREYCSICGHITENSYENRCIHLKSSMNKIQDDGKKVYAISGVPYKLFDISFVVRPADRVAYTLMTKS